MRWHLCGSLLLLGVVVSTALPTAPRADPHAMPPAVLEALRAAAVAASDDARYCDAMWLFESLHLREPREATLYNAAEVARAAGDRLQAITLYRQVIARYPSFKPDVIKAQIASAHADFVRYGPGAACPLRTNTCGDWRLADREACDDGNTTSGDGCDQNCMPTGCGNGVVTDGEVCDDGNSNNGDGCDSNCTVTACGNAVMAGAEACDDGNAQSGDGCDQNCTVSACGNGVVTAGEACDDGNSLDGDGCDRNCTVTACGNAIVTKGEMCDDGNTADGDGCEARCVRTREPAPFSGLVVMTAGALGAGAGGLALIPGALLTVEIENANRRLNDAESAALRASTQADVAAAASEAAAARTSINDAEALNAFVGQPLFYVGTAVVVGGVAALGVGAFLALTDTREVAE